MTDTMTNNALSPDYADPVGMLLAAGDTDTFRSAEWPDYPEQYGFGPEHVPELIRMACDVALHNGDGMRPEVWAPVHAWRALGQLRATESVEPLLACMSAIRDSEAPYEELSDVFGLLGPAAIPPITAFLADRTLDPSVAATAMFGLTKIVERHHEYRGECIAVLSQVLEHAVDTSPETNGWAVASLLDLSAVEAIDTIREAFRRDAVDISMAGDLEDVEIDLGLRERRVTPKPYYPFASGRFSSQELFPGTGFGDSHQEFDETPRPVKVGRNEPCPCGSGKKYKKCCLG